MDHRQNCFYGKYTRLTKRNWVAYFGQTWAVNQCDLCECDRKPNPHLFSLHLWKSPDHPVLHDGRWCIDRVNGLRWRISPLSSFCLATLGVHRMTGDFSPLSSPQIYLSTLEIVGTCSLSTFYQLLHVFCWNPWGILGQTKRFFRGCENFLPALA